MPILPFVDWNKGLFLDPRKELWPFVLEITLGHGDNAVYVANRSNHDYDACIFFDSPSFSKMMGCAFWNLGGRTTPLSTVVGLKTKAGVVLFETEDMKEYLIL
jgi:hypothetical protein